MLQNASPAQLIEDRGETVTVQGKTAGPVVLVLSDLHYPGWNATISAKRPRKVEITPAFGRWRAVYIPDGGDFEVTFRYEPQSFRTGCRLTFAAVVFWLICFAASFLKR
jgi:hypothetical protein